MKRNAKQNGSGGRLRLALLLATAAAFLLVPAAQAMAAEGHMTVTLAGTGKGEVTSVGTGQEGTPPLECSNIVGKEKSTCENEMFEVEEEVFEENLQAIPGPHSEFTGWTVEEGIGIDPEHFPNFCTTGPKCNVLAEGGNAKLKASFKPKPRSYVTVEGAGAGSGTITSEGGTKNLNCHITAGKPDEEEGEVCEAEVAKFVELIATETPDSGSEFIEWNYSGGGEASECEASTCTIFFTATGEEGTLTPTFEPEPLNKFIIEAAGTGSGTVTSEGEGTIVNVNCHITEGELDGGAGSCVGEVQKLVLASPFPGKVHVTFTPDNVESEFVECSHTGGGLTPCDEEPPFNEQNPFELAFFGSGEVGTWTVTTSGPVVLPHQLNLTTSGEGTGSFECDTGSGAEACQAEYKEGTHITVIPVAGAHSVFAEFNSEKGGECSGATCELTMEENELHVNAMFDLELKTLNTTLEGEGSLACEDATASVSAPCAASQSYPYGHTIKVVATPASENELASLTGGGSAEGNCSLGTEECSFPITATSSVSAEFVSAESEEKVRQSQIEGTVPTTTSLGAGCEHIDFGKLIPGVPDYRYHEQCILTATATGYVNTLTAKDDTGFGEEGHLFQESSPGHPFNLPEPLEIKAVSGQEPLGDNGTLEPLDKGGVTLVTYSNPVSADTVATEFSQWIREHDRLHSGVYSKTITLTLKQTNP